MSAGASTPEELETLLEDAFVVCDRAAVAALFVRGAVMIAIPGAIEARGREAIAVCASTLWAGEQTYVAAPHHVIQARDTGLVVSERGINVMRRASDRSWRYAISLLRTDTTQPKGTGDDTAAHG